MATWARRVHRRAATFGNAVSFCGTSNLPFPRRLEKVRFGVELKSLRQKDIPGPLLVLILKLNKEAPPCKDVFRAPGHQGAMKKLIHSLETGRLVNVANYSVYTIASVIKKFLRKIPHGVFGEAGEVKLFASVDLPEQERDDIMRRLLRTLPLFAQRLLVLLIGTFRMIAKNAVKSCTGMTSEALGVSVAPSFFHSCVSNGKTATMDDVQRFKVATRIMRQMIDQFSSGDLFGRENYEYYTRVTGRILCVHDEWICSFDHPRIPRRREAQDAFAKKLSLVPENTWLQCEVDRLGNRVRSESPPKPEEYHSLPTLMDVVGGNTVGTVLNLGVIPEHSLLDSCTRLSISLEESVFKSTRALMAVLGGATAGTVLGFVAIPEHSLVKFGTLLSVLVADEISVSSTSQSSQTNSSPLLDREALRALNKYAESTKSLTYLPQVGSDATRDVGPSAPAGAEAPRAGTSRPPILRCRSLSSLGE